MSAHHIGVAVDEHPLIDIEVSRGGMNSGTSRFRLVSQYVREVPKCQGPQKRFKHSHHPSRSRQATCLRRPGLRADPVDPE
jgi:hypothetical protein